jgi:chromatin segregation and condensation protein Rec8/ScpA/Scc1 (kleisin family)
MDAVADPQTGLDGQAVSDGPSTASRADGAEVGEGGSPRLTLDGFTGSLDNLLVLARAQKIDIATISLTALIDQLTTALRQAPAATSLGEKADWVVMAAWLVQLRTRLLLPADAPGQQQAAAEADQLRVRLVALEEMQALAMWLEQRPQLGRDVFARAGGLSCRARLQRSGWATTFVAGLELAKQGVGALGQGEDFKPIHVAKT